jgi:pilus assembly protein CpaE
MSAAMKPKPISVSILEGAQASDPGLLQTLQSIPDLRLLEGARDPEAFLTLYEDKPPDLVLVELNGQAAIPVWLEKVIERLPRSKVFICSQSRDPDFLIQVMKLRTGGFIPLPLHQEELQSAIEQIKIARIKQSEGSQSQILAVTGAKGGVGATSVAVNLAVALAELLKGGVVLVDLARPFPHVGQFLNLQSTHTIRDLTESSESLDSMFMQKVVQKHPSGLDVLLGPQSFSSGSLSMEFTPFPEPQFLKKVFSALRSAYNWIVVDLGAWVDPFYFQMIQAADQILLVTELTVPDLRNLKILNALWYDWDLHEGKIKIVVNRYVKDYTIGLKDVETVCHHPVFFTLPDDREDVREAINQGVALGEQAPRSRLWRRFKDLAGELVAELERQTEKPGAARPGLLRRLLLKG